MVELRKTTKITVRQDSTSSRVSLAIFLDTVSRERLVSQCATTGVPLQGFTCDASFVRNCKFAL
jgi:hypothetical protein